MLKTVTFCLVIVLTSGNSLDDKIIGGDNANINDFPYQISLQNRGSHICGGTIIDENTILTAAHCTYGIFAANLQIRAGSTNKNNGGQIVPVKEIRQHPYFNFNTKDNDIAIIKLWSPLKLGTGISSLALQNDGAEVPSNTKTVVTGWGMTEIGSTDTLRKVVLNIRAQKDCKDDYSGEAIITENMICTRTPGKDSCQGDSGGPLVAAGKLIGVVSWGLSCADPYYPGVYAKVSACRKWIDENRY